ncbi:MAG: chemotaxis protein [Oscillospiraceae bacterium]|nr:chemotaxis protein [Oscillospiraceae bacterium]
MNMENIGVENEIDPSELELLEFLVGEESFGINIAKVSEIIIHCDVTHVPSAPRAVEGVFMHRDKLVTVIDLHEILEIEKPERERTLLVVCDFDQVSVAFDVTNVNGIQRLKWAQVEKPPAISGNTENSLATGVAKINEKIIMILDFEKIVCDMNAGKDFEIGEVSEIYSPPEFDYSRKLLIIEDSVFLNKVVSDAFKKVGFTNISQFYNGKDAWTHISGLKGTELRQTLGGIVCDIEMPQMDGHTLVRLVKKDKELTNTPIIMFSSLIHDNMRQKGDSAGADAQYSRAQLSECIKTMIELMSER